jgi:hypothetical protein
MKSRRELAEEIVEYLEQEAGKHGAAGYFFLGTNQIDAIAAKLPPDAETVAGAVMNDDDLCYLLGMWCRFKETTRHGEKAKKRLTAAIIDRHAKQIDAEGLAKHISSKCGSSLYRNHHPPRPGERIGYAVCFERNEEDAVAALTAEIREFLAKKEAQR